MKSLDSWQTLLLVRMGQGRYLNLSPRHEYNDWVRLCLLADEVNKVNPNVTQTHETLGIVSDNTVP